MMQASEQVAQLDAQVQEERRRDGLAPFLKPWRDASAALRAAFRNARADLERHGTSREQLEGIEGRLQDLQRRLAKFDLGADLVECSGAWGHLSQEIAALRGTRREELLGFLAARKDAIDRATAGLTEARDAGGVHPDQSKKLRALEDERDRACERQGRLRDEYLRSAREHAASRPSGSLAPVAVMLPELFVPRGPLRSGRPGLEAVIERGRHHGLGVVQRFEKTLTNLATAGHRTLTDPRAGELRGHLARMDGILARLKGKMSAAELSDGARQVGALLAQMGDLAAAGGRSAALHPFPALLEERRAALARLAGEAQKAAGAQALHLRGALSQPSAAALGEKQLQTLRKLHPGIERLLRDASASQLTQDLGFGRAPGLGSQGLGGLGRAIAGAHLGSFAAASRGLLGALGEHASSGRAAAVHPQATVRELHELLGTLKQAPAGAPLQRIAAQTEDRRRQLAERAKARLHGRGPAQVSAQALAEAFHGQRRTDFAAHVAPGGALYQLLQAAQRSQGLPIPHLASHFLQARGAQPLVGTLQLFDQLRAQGYGPHFGLFSRLKHAAGDALNKATKAVANTAADVARSAGGLVKVAGGAVRSGISDLGHQAWDAGQRISSAVHAAAGSVGQGAAGAGRAALAGARHLSAALEWGAHWAGDGAAVLARAASSAATRTTQTIAGLAQAGFRVTDFGAAVLHGAGEAGKRTYGFARGAVHTGLDALHRTGVAGGIGKGLRFGLSMLKPAASYSPIGLGAQMGIGALTGVASALGSGGSLKDALKGAAAGGVGFFDPGALKALGRLKGLKAAQHIVQGKQLSKREKLAVEGSHLKGPLGALEKLMASKSVRRTMGGLEKLYSKGVKGGILLSGKAARAQGYLEKALAMGDWLEGGLSLIHQLAPQVAEAVGDNALGQLIAQAGDYAGEHHRLKKALEMGHGASGALQRSRGYLEGGLEYAGVKDPQKAYERRMARLEARAGKPGGIEAVAKDKLARHRLRHPELHDDAQAHRPLQLVELGRAPRQHEPRSALERALARGKALKKGALEVAQGVHGGLEKVHGTVGKGLAYAGGAQGGLEKAAALARQGGSALGAHTELGAYLLHLADRADQAHEYLEQGVAFAKDFNERVRKVEGGLERIPGVHPEAAPEKRKKLGEALEAEHLRLGTPAEHAAAVRESGEEQSRRLKPAKKPVENALAKLQRLQKNAVRMGRKLDPKLGKVEGKLRRGIAAGGKVEHGLEEVSRITGVMGELFGDDSALGHFAEQVHQSVDKGHDKLHGALQLVTRGKKGLHEGRELLEEVLHLGARHHVGQVHEAPGPAGGPADVQPQGAPAGGSDPHAALHAAAQAVAHFGAAVDGAIKAVERLLERGRSIEAAERVRSVQEVGNHAAAAVREAERACAKVPTLAMRAAKLRDNLQEIRAHFHQLVSGVQGVDSIGAAVRGREPAPGRGRRAQGDLVDEVLRGIDDGRIFVDRGAHRGERPDRDHQDVDSAAIDSWIGSGESVKLFSEVFGAFLPIEETGRRGTVHRRRHGKGARSRHAERGQSRGDEKDRAEPRKGKGGFFAKVFQKVEGFAEGIAHAAHARAGLLGKAMHYAEMGLHGLNVVEHAAGKVHDFAGKAEGFLYRMHLGSAAGLAHKVGEASAWIDARAEEAHGGLKTADEYLGEGKHDLEAVESLGHKAAKIARRAGKGRSGDLLNVFRAAAGGDGIDGKLQPDQVRLGSSLDEPRRLDALTQARMEQFLGGDLTGVRVHVGPGAAQITSRYAAEAVTVKDHIFFAPGKFNPATVEGQKLLAHELTHVLQKGRKNLDVRTAETEALHSEHTYGPAPAMEPLNLSRPAPDFKLPDAEGAPASDGIYTAKRTRSRGYDAGGRDEVPDGEEFLEMVSGRVYELLMDELEQAFESR